MNGRLYAVKPDGTKILLGEISAVKLKFPDPRIQLFHDRVAAAMGRGRLRCRSCQASFDLCAELVSNFVATGWPKCCGGTMSYDGPFPFTGGQA